MSFKVFPEPAISEYVGPWDTLFEQQWIRGYPNVTGIAWEASGLPTTNANGQLQAAPFFVPLPLTLDQIGWGHTAPATGTVIFGLYEDDGTGYPGALVAGSEESVTANAVAGFHSRALAAGNLVLDKGLYWIACLQNSALGTSWWMQNSDGGMVAKRTWRVTDGAITSATSSTRLLYGGNIGPAPGALPDPFTAGFAVLSNSNIIFPVWRIAVGGLG